MLKRNYSSILSGILCLLLLTSCNDSPSSFSDSPPPLPSSQSMEMDFSSFENNKQRAGAQVQTVENFSRAVGTAVIMKTIVDLNLAVPKVLFAASQETEAEFNEDGHWEWSYSHTAGSETYDVSLQASRASDNTISWNFYVTSPKLNLDNRLLFSGTTNAEGTEGTWNYYSLKSSDTEEAVSQIDWKVDGEENVELRLEVLSDRNDYQGDYIEYTYNGTLKTAVYSDKSKNQSTELQINTETNAGYIITPDYNDGEKACWDESFQNIACSEL